MKRLTRNKNDKILFGVCGGIGRYFDIDPVIIRIIFIVLLFTAGTGFLAYIIAIFIIPEEMNSFNDKNFNITDETKTTSTPSNENQKNDEKIIYESADNKNNEDTEKSNNSSEITGTIIGIALIVFGTLFLMRNFSFLDNIYYSIMPVIRRFFWPGILIGLGALIIYKNKE